VQRSVEEWSGVKEEEVADGVERSRIGSGYRTASGQRAGREPPASIMSSHDPWRMAHGRGGSVSK
jgi:hypothetical protein